MIRPLRNNLRLLAPLLAACGLLGSAGGAEAADRTAPTVSLQNPFSSIHLRQPERFFFRATAEDNVGVAKVELWENGKRLATDTRAPFLFVNTFDSEDNGLHAIYVLAYDWAGNSTLSNTVRVLVAIPGDDDPPPTAPDPTPPPTTTPPGVEDKRTPTVAITNLINYSVFKSPRITTIQTRSNDDVGVVRVEFYDGAVLRHTDRTAPFDYAWSVTAAENGNHDWSVRAYDASGKSGRSPLATRIKIDIPGGPDSGGTSPGGTTPSSDQIFPTVAFTSPPNNGKVSAPMSVTLRTSAHDGGGVAHVEFFLDGNKVATDTTSPYSTTWRVDASHNGQRHWHAVAADRSGNETTATLVLNVAIPTANPDPKPEPEPDTEPEPEPEPEPDPEPEPEPEPEPNDPVVAGNTPEVQGFVPAMGSAMGIAVEDGTAFVASDIFGVTVLEANGGKLNTVGNPADAFVGRRIVSRGKLGVVAGISSDDTVHFWSVDLANPVDPVVLGELSTGVHRRHLHDLTLSPDGNLAVASMGGYGIWVIDVRNPARLRLLSETLLSSSVKGFSFADGSNRGVAAITSGVEVLDLSNPSSVRSLGEVDALGLIRDVDYQDGWAFAVASSGYLHVIDLNAMRKVTTRGVSGNADRIVVDGNRAFAIIHRTGEDVVQTFDISSPSSPKYLFERAVGSTDTAQDIAVSDGLLYVAALDRGVQVYDRNGTMDDKVDDDLTPVATHGARGVAMAVNRVEATETISITTIDTSDPAHPLLVGRIDTSLALSSARDVVVADSGRFGIAALRGDGLWMIDLANPASPRVLAKYSTPAAALSVTLSRDGRTAFVAMGSKGMHVVNVSNPASPRALTTYARSGYAIDVAVSGSYAYLSHRYGEVSILDVSQPASPRRLGGHYAYGHKIAVRGDTMAVLTSTSAGDSLQVVDVSNPAKPVLRGTVSIGALDIASDVVVTGSRALVAAKGDGVHVYDISDRTRPRFVDNALPVDEALSISMDRDGMIYVTDFPSVVDVVRMVD